MKTSYKQTKIGVIPEEWKVNAIANVVELTLPICYDVVQIGQYIESGVPIVEIEFVKEIAHAPPHRTARSLEKPYPPEAPLERRTKMYSGGSGWRMESVQMDSIETAEEIGFILSETLIYHIKCLIMEGNDY